jgi:hypothetical protein
MHNHYAQCVSKSPYMMTYVKSKFTTIKIKKFVVILLLYQGVPSHDLHNQKSHMLLQPTFSHSYFNLLSFLLYNLINCKRTQNVHQLHHKNIPISTHLQQYLPHVAHNTLIPPLN